MSQKGSLFLFVIFDIRNVDAKIKRIVNPLYPGSGLQIPNSVD